MTKPKVSIIIPNWNGRHFLTNCLESLRSQTFDDFEVIVVDNGSTDGSLAWLMEHFPEVHRLTLDKNYGFSVAINRGIVESAGEYVFLLNNDTELDERCLAELVSALDEKPEAGFCATKMLYFDQRQIINDVGDTFSVYGIAHQEGKGEFDLGQFEAERWIFGACAGAAMYRRKLFEIIGLLDEDFFAYLEDVDLSFRAQSAGFKCLYVPKAVVYHVDGGTSKSINNFSRFLTLRNSLYLIAKNMPLALICRLLPFLIVGQARNFFIGVKHGCIGLVVRVYVDFFRHLPRLLKKRWMVQKLKKADNRYLWSMLNKKYPFSVRYSFKEMFK